MYVDVCVLFLCHISAEQEKKSTVSTSEGSGGGGADWLGLGSDDTGLELELPTYKPPTPSRNTGRRTESHRSGK